jgi:DNA-binding NtrC family response regulator
MPVDVRLVAATNVELASAVAAGNFRRDLFYRINIAQIKLLPLCDRPGDILPLAEHFLKHYSQKMNLKQPKFSAQAIDLLLHYSWPGNIRELENVVHFALLVAGQHIIDPIHLKITGGWEAGGLHSVTRPRKYKNKSKQNHLYPESSHIQDEKLTDPLAIIEFQLSRLFAEFGNGPHFEKLESLIIHQAFLHAGSNQVHGATLLGISRNVMRTLLKRHGLLESQHPYRERDFDNRSSIETLDLNAG